MRRLMVVSVEQNKIVLGDQIGQDDFVRGRSAVEYEIGFFGAKDRRRLLLRSERRTLMRQKVAEFENGVIEVVTKNRFAKMFHENPADWAAAIKNAAIVAGTGPELIASSA